MTDWINSILQSKCSVTLLPRSSLKIKDWTTLIYRRIRAGRTTWINTKIASPSTEVIVVKRIIFSWWSTSFSDNRKISKNFRQISNSREAMAPPATVYGIVNKSWQRAVFRCFPSATVSFPPAVPANSPTSSKTLRKYLGLSYYGSFKKVLNNRNTL